MDLSLLPIEALIEEIKKRSDIFVVGMVRYDSGEQIVDCYHSKKKWMEEVGLAECLKNDVLNNFEAEEDNGI